MKKYNRLLLYLRTIKYLRFRQIVYNIVRRLSGKPQIPDAQDTSCLPLSLSLPIKYRNIIDSDSVLFLNLRRSLTDCIDWLCKEETKLWRYNLHYFDYLLDDGVSVPIKDRLIDSWIDKVDIQNEDGWEPYPLSLRIVNWIKYFIVYKDNTVPCRWKSSLYKQANILFRSIEYHILANHFWKNGKALLFAGSWLSGSDAERWFHKGKKIVLNEIAEQILKDGGHYEKSPMYHSIFVEDLLDILNIAQSNELDVSDAEIEFLRNSSLNSLLYLKQIQMPDGEIPLFNDAAFGIASHPNELSDYAERVMAYWVGLKPGEKKFPERYGTTTTKLINSKSTIKYVGQSVTCLDDSGYYIIRDGCNACFIDCGSVSPDYQPGHTHCDLLSYELAIDGVRVIVDTGVYNYEDSEERYYCRSTRAHNTIEIDGREQTEIWGQFRVARRAKVLSAKLVQLVEDTDRCCIFKGSYQPYWSGRSGIQHSREIIYQKRQWRINDRIDGKGYHEVNNFIHFHPDVAIRFEANEYYLELADKRIAKAVFSANTVVYIERGWYFPEFGIKKKNCVIRIFSKGTLPMKQQYQIIAL